jgi:phosphotransferase system enzyme I (PtsI)
MITSVWEVREVKKHCEEVKKELDAEGIPYSREVELGIMIETPAAALISGTLAPMVDFFSVGTHDLSQYTLACDRQNPEIARFFDEHHEAVLQLIAMAAQQAHRHGKWIGICGELAADVSLTETFLRMGIDELSVAPSAVLHLRETVRSLDLSQARA